MNCIYLFSANTVSPYKKYNFKSLLPFAFPQVPAYQYCLFNNSAVNYPLSGFTDQCDSKVHWPLTKPSKIHNIAEMKEKKVKVFLYSPWVCYDLNIIKFCSVICTLFYFYILHSFAFLTLYLACDCQLYRSENFIYKITRVEKWKQINTVHAIRSTFMVSGI